MSGFTIPLARRSRCDASGKEYTRYTGYPGGLRITSLANLIQKKGVGEALWKAVDGMIPRNKLRKERMKRLTITD